MIQNKNKIKDISLSTYINQSVLLIAQPSTHGHIGAKTRMSTYIKLVNFLKRKQALQISQGQGNQNKHEHM